VNSACPVRREGEPALSLPLSAKGHATSVHGEFERRLVSCRAGMFTSDIKLFSPFLKNLKK